MAVRTLKDGVYTVGAIDWDRRLFDQLIPLPEGTTYNAYLIRGTEKTALIDTVDKRKQQDLLANLKSLEIDRIDYIISNHAEQDHSESIVKLLELYPDAVVVTNSKCKEFLKELLLVVDNKFKTINDGETLSLGDKTLEFIIFPWVHWPETMLTYLREDHILFPCDLFGSHLATSDLYADDERRVYPSAKRYYAQIMMPFRTIIRKNMDKLKRRNIEIIAPSHGPVYNRPSFILDAYRSWLSDDVTNEVIVPYVSMHGSTQRMVDYFVNRLIEQGVTVKPFNLIHSDLGELAMALVDAATVVLGTPTVLVGPHPAAVYAAYLMNALRPKTKFISIIGSYGWGGKAVDIIKGMLTNITAELIEPVIIKGNPRQIDFEMLDGLINNILERHLYNHIMKA